MSETVLFSPLEPEATIQISEDMEISVSSFDVTTHRGSYVAITPRGGAVRISARTCAVLRARAAGASFEEIAQDLGKRELAHADAREVEEFHAAIVRRIEAADANADSSSGGHLKFSVLSARLVSVLARPLTPLYNRTLVPVCIIAIAAAACAAALTLLTSPAKPHVDGTALGQAYLLYFVSLIFHELGHASATLAFGEAPAAIGVTLYLIFPALYSDVTRTWRLRRAERVVVDLAGSYIQLLVAAVYVAFYLVTKAPGLYYAVGAIVVTTLFNLNPLFKFDGYWFASDALGIANLSKQPIALARAVWDFIRGRGGETVRHGGKVLVVLTIYSVAVFAAWGYMFWRIGWSLFAGWPRTLRDTFLIVSHPALATPKSIEAMGLQLLVMALTVLGVFNLVRSTPFYKPIRVAIHSGLTAVRARLPSARPTRRGS